MGRRKGKAEGLNWLFTWVIKWLIDKQEGMGARACVLVAVTERAELLACGTGLGKKVSVW